MQHRNLPTWDDINTQAPHTAASRLPTVMQTGAAARLSTPSWKRRDVLLYGAARGLLAAGFPGPTVLVEMYGCHATSYGGEVPHAQLRLGRRPLVKRLCVVFLHLLHCFPFQLHLMLHVSHVLLSQLLALLVVAVQYVSLRTLRQPSVLQQPLSHTRWLCLLLSQHMPCLQLLRRGACLLVMLRLHQLLLLLSRVALKRQLAGEVARARHERQGCKRVVSSCRPALLPQVSPRLRRQLSPARVLLLQCVYFIGCLFLDVEQLQEGPLAVHPTASSPHQAATAAPYSLIRTERGAAGKERKVSGIIAVSAVPFRSLVPPFPPDLFSTRGKVRGPSQLYVAPPTLQISSVDSKRCSCQQEGAAQRKHEHHTSSRRTSRVTRDSTGSDEARESRNEERDNSDSDFNSGRNRGELPVEGWCCTPDERWQALRRVFEAPGGVAFASVGDSGHPGVQMERTAAILAKLGEQVNLRYVNLMGDNFYPHGVHDLIDPQWHATFDDTFSQPTIEKVAFFPVLGNHDYGLNPYAQIERYMRSHTEKGRAAAFSHLSAEGARLQEKLRASRYRSGTSASNTTLGVIGDRWRFPNYWYFTRHVFTNVPYRMANPFKVGMNVDDYSETEKIQEAEQHGKVVVVTLYMDTMVLVADGYRDMSAPYIFAEDEIYHLQLKFIEAVLQAAQGDADWIFICGHHPVMTDANRQRNLPRFGALMEGLMKKYSVDAYVSGHEHLLGCFRDDAGTAATYIISGSASKLNSPCRCLRKSCRFNSSTPGFVLHLLSKTEMHHVFVSNRGEVLFTQTQYVRQRQRDDTREIPDDISLLAYPNIRRVYIGPSDVHLAAAGAQFSPHWYFLFGAVVAGSCALLVAGLAWLCCALKHRKSAIVSAFWTRWNLRRAEQVPAKDTKLCREILVINRGGIEAPVPSEFRKDLQSQKRSGAAELPRRAEAATDASASTSRALRKSSSSSFRTTLRKSYTLQPWMENRKDSTSTTGEAQRLLDFAWVSRGCRHVCVPDDLPPPETIGKPEKCGGS